MAPEIRYVGSAEHKSHPSPAGPPALPSDAARCAPVYANRFDDLTRVLQDAVRLRCTSSEFERGFPKYVWGLLDGAVYEARHLSGRGGEYKAYKLEDPAEYPPDPEGRLRLP